MNELNLMPFSKTLTEEEKLKLIKAIEVEKQLFIEKGSSTYKHDEVIRYLKKGIAPVRSLNNELLYSAIHDLITLYNDYVFSYLNNEK